MKVNEIGQIFICDKCGNEVITTKVGGGKLMCCDKNMKPIEGNEAEIMDEGDEEAEE